jgi:hypothetical protein
MAKKPDQSHPVICDLLHLIVGYAESLTEPPFDSNIIPIGQRKPTIHRIIATTPEEKLNGIIKILFGEEDVKLKPGRRGFIKQDTELMNNMREQMEAENKTKEDLIDNYTGLAQAQSDKTSDESIRARLEDRYYATNPKKQPGYGCDYEQYGASGYENLERDELCIIIPWLIKYKKQILDILKDID